MKVSELRVGDEFLVTGTQQRARLGGVIVKINRVNLTYTSQYQPNPSVEALTLTLKVAKVELVGGKMARNGTVENIEGE